MRLEEAESIRKMIDSHWNLHMGTEVADLWVTALLPHDAQEATSVVAHLAQKMHYAPKIVDFKEVMRMLHPPAQPEGLPAPEYKFGVEAPEWVWVWSWARWQREPHEERSFPQQSGHVDETETMTMDEYTALLDEWEAAGRPKAKNPLPMFR